MDGIEKKIRCNELFSIYGELLSATQNQILADYYSLDLSITEIAENRSVSRSAVEDAIKKGTAKLEEYENKLHFLKQKRNIRKLIEEGKGKNPEADDVLAEIERIINDGI